MEKRNLSIRGINRGVWSQFKAKCSLLNVPVGDRLNYLLSRDIEKVSTK